MCWKYSQWWWVATRTLSPRPVPCTSTPKDKVCPCSSWTQCISKTIWGPRACSQCSILLNGVITTTWIKDGTDSDFTIWIFERIYIRSTLLLTSQSQIKFLFFLPFYHTFFRFFTMMIIQSQNATVFQRNNIIFTLDYC